MTAKLRASRLKQQKAKFINQTTRLALLLTINIHSYKCLHDCVNEVKNFEQLKETGVTGVTAVKARHFLVLCVFQMTLAKNPEKSEEAGW